MVDLDDKDPLNSSLVQMLSELPPSVNEHCASRPSPVEIDENHIEPEPQDGNMEYKLKLIDPSPSRFQHLVTQMKWRLAEGNGEALYVIGVEDDGYLTGLPPDQLQASLRTLESMAAAAGAVTTVLRARKSVRGSGQVAEVLVRRVPDNQQFLEVRVAAVGSAGSGKSTILGVLIGEELDNGHGKARLNLFRHRHEITSGTTSSIWYFAQGIADGAVTACSGSTAQER
jgi:GTPase